MKLVSYINIYSYCKCRLHLRMTVKKFLNGIQLISYWYTDNWQYCHFSWELQRSVNAPVNEKTQPLPKGLLCSIQIHGGWYKKHKFASSNTPEPSYWIGKDFQYLSNWIHEDRTSSEYDINVIQKTRSLRNL